MRTFTLLLLLLLSIVPTTWGQCTENRSTATDTTWDIQTKLNSLPSIWTPVKRTPSMRRLRRTMCEGGRDLQGERLQDCSWCTPT